MLKIAVKIGPPEAEWGFRAFLKHSQARTNIQKRNDDYKRKEKNIKLNV